MGVTDYNIPLVVASPFIAALIFCLLLLIGRGLRGLYRWAREAAQPLDRAARGARGRLGPGGRPHLPGGQRPAAPGLCQRHEQRVFGARHEDRRRGAPAHDQPAFGRAGLAHPVGHAGLARPQLHRQGPVGERHREVHRPSGHGADPRLRRAGVSRRRGGPGRAGGQGPRARGRFPAQEPAGGDDDRQRLGRPGAGGHVRVPQRRRLRDRGDPVFLPAVVDFLPGRPVEGPRGGPCALRRGLRRLGEAAPGPAPQAVRRRGKPGVVRRRGRLHRRKRPGQPHRRRAVRRAAQLQHAVPGIQRPPRRRQPGGPARLPGRADRPVRERPGYGHPAGRASPGTAAGSCT